MTPALLGKKIGMTRVYDEKGAVVPVTNDLAGQTAGADEGPRGVL